MLAEYEFVEEVEGPGRQKPWRRVSAPQDITPDGLDPETAMAAETAVLVHLDQEFSRMRERMITRKLLPDDWRDVVDSHSGTKFLAAEEAMAYEAELVALMGKYSERAEDASLRPEGARPVRSPRPLRSNPNDAC